MIALANSMAAHYAASARGSFHVEKDDLVGAALLAKAQGRDMEHGIIDQLRKLGSRRGQRDRRQFQLKPRHMKGRDNPDYIAHLALKKCGVMMLEACLNDNYRRVIMLRYWHALTQAEAAAEMGITQGRVGQIERAACKVIAAELALRGIKSMRDVI